MYSRASTSIASIPFDVCCNGIACLCMREQGFDQKLTCQLFQPPWFLVSLFAEPKFVPLSSQVCVIGAGKMSRLLFKHMAAKGCTSAVLLNRSLPRAQAMAEEFPQVRFLLIVPAHTLRSRASYDGTSLRVTELQGANSDSLVLRCNVSLLIALAIARSS